MGEEITAGAKKRICKWDNVRALLILLVVTGHVISGYTEQMDAYRSVYIFIWAFHMPLFIFVSGYFHRNRNIKNKIVFYVILGLLLRLIIFSVKNLWLGFPNTLEVFTDGTQWYMFAMAAWIALAYFMRRYDGRLILVLALIFGCFSGYDQNIEDFMALSRIIVFFPFYQAGILARENGRFVFGDASGAAASRDVSGERTRAARPGRYIPALIGLLVLIGWGLICVFKLDLFYQFRPFFKGNTPFSPEYSGSFLGLFMRAASYLISGGLSLAAMAVVPGRHLPVISQIGQRSLAVYFWHRPVVYILEGFGILDAVYSLRGRFGIIICTLISVLLVLLFSRPIFNRPLEWLRRKILNAEEDEMPGSKSRASEGE